MTMLSLFISCKFALFKSAIKLMSLSDLPTSAGWLAYWQLFVAATAVFNFVQNFVTLKFTRRIYNNVPPNAGKLLYRNVLKVN
jgi:Erg28 like protein